MALLPTELVPTVKPPVPPKGPKVLIAIALAYLFFVGMHFPFSIDPPKAPRKTAAPAQKFYDDAFSPPVEQSKGESNYERIAREAAQSVNVKGQLEEFVKKYNLGDKRILEVGAGSGSLQDVVSNYTGLDISASARRHFHKPFVQASATDMPFNDGEFDSVWTVWVLEHIPNPEHAMIEIRRVVKDGGYLFFMPAWDCNWWAAEGYEVRPYSDLDVRGKASKAILPLLQSPLYRLTYKLPVNTMRWATASFSRPTNLHFQRIEANFDKYWQPDSDAVVSLDPFEAYLWFTSRGDECLNCPPNLAFPVLAHKPMLIRVHKK